MATLLRLSGLPAQNVVVVKAIRMLVEKGGVRRPEGWGENEEREEREEREGGGWVVVLLVLRLAGRGGGVKGG